MAGSGDPSGATVLALRRQPSPRPAGHLARRGTPGRLDGRMRDFIGRQHMMLLTGPGMPGGALRTGPPGFVRVPDPQRLAWPEPPADERLTGLHTVGDSLPVELRFLDLFHDLLGLYVLGTATVVDVSRSGSWVSLHVEAARLRRAGPPRPALALVAATPSTVDR